MWYGGSSYRETFTEEQLLHCFHYLDSNKPDLESLKVEFPNGIRIGGHPISLERYRGMCLHLLKEQEIRNGS